MLLRENHSQEGRKAPVGRGNRRRAMLQRAANAIAGVESHFSEARGGGMAGPKVKLDLKQIL